MGGHLLVLTELRSEDRSWTSGRPNAAHTQEERGKTPAMRASAEDAH